MHSSTTAPARRTPHDAKSNFVSFPARSPRRDLAVKSALLLALKALGDARPGEPPSVMVSLASPSEIGLSSTLVKKAGKRAIQLDLGNNLGTVKEALFGPEASCLDQRVLKKRRLYVDEGFLHEALKPWEKATDVESLLLASSSFRESSTLTFTVRFGDRRSRTSSDPGALLRSLRNEIGPIAKLGPLMMVVEVDSKGRQHLHGMVQTSETIPAVKKLVRRLGGGSSNYRFENLHQVKVEDATSCMGWCHYMLKDLAALSQSEASESIYLSSAAKAAARQLLDELTWVSRRQLLIKPERRGHANVYRPSRVRSRAGTLALAA